MATFFKRLARAAPIAFPQAFRGQSNSSFANFRVPIGAIAAISGGISYFYDFNSPNLVHLDQINEETSQRVALNPDKWIEFKLQEQDTAKIAGGSGTTPMLQIIEDILRNPDDSTKISLLYANVSPDDILLKKKLDVLEDSHPNLKIFYTVDSPSKNWRGGTGYISKDMAVKGLPGPSEDSLILVCGAPGMMKHISGDTAKDRSQGELTGILKEVGYTGYGLQILIDEDSLHFRTNKFLKVTIKNTRS